MLKVTNDGRKLALDQRMMNPMLPDAEGSKVNACVGEVYRIWEKNSDKKLTQLLFCDLSTPKRAGEFSVYIDIRKKLMERGIPESEIRFIHEADTEVKKQELFQKVRRGEVRILMGLSLIHIYQGAVVKLLPLPERRKRTCVCFRKMWRFAMV